jgi:hypothetical protein
MCGAAAAELQPMQGIIFLAPFHLRDHNTNQKTNSSKL